LIELTNRYDKYRAERPTLWWKMTLFNI
jgi:hypothetical protein